MRRYKKKPVERIDMSVRLKVKIIEENDPQDTAETQDEMRRERERQNAQYIQSINEDLDRMAREAAAITTLIDPTKTTEYFLEKYSNMCHNTDPNRNKNSICAKYVPDLDWLI